MAHSRAFRSCPAEGLRTSEDDSAAAAVALDTSSPYAGIPQSG
jgi:hypothetical protein